MSAPSPLWTGRSCGTSGPLRRLGALGIAGTLLAAAAIPACGAVDDPPATAPSAPAPAPAQPAGASTDDLRKQGDAAAAAGMAAMKGADADPHQAVDAAIDFSHALSFYDRLGDTDAVCEMQANIFWCKKRMNLDNLQEYVAKKGELAQREFGAAQAVMDKSVPASEAAAYFDRASKYRDANADQHFEIAIRFSEVIERFPDSDQAHQASPIFATEQSAYLAQVERERTQEKEQLQQELTQIRRTRFMQPPQAIGGTPVAMPAKDDLEHALATVRSLYKDAYGKARLESQKRALARRLTREAEKSRDNPAGYHEMLSESVRLASEAEDYQTLLDDCDHLAAAFIGLDAAALKKAALSRMTAHTTAAAILTLLTTPADKSANLVVGKFYCYSLGRWPDGLDMLTNSGEAVLQKLALDEIAGPRDAEEQRLLADAWYDCGHHASGPDRLGAWGRARHWYDSCVGSLTGINQQLVQKRLDELDKVLPLVITNWNSLTARQWQNLHATTLVVDAHTDRSDSGMTMAGERIRIVACPDDTWNWSTSSDTFTCGADGGTPSFDRPRGGRGRRGGGGAATDPTTGASFLEGQLSFQVDDGPCQPLGVISGSGHLWLKPQNGWGLMGAGSIRIKLIPVEDDQDQ